jgi:hypothetical protein
MSFTDLDRCQADYFESFLTSLEASFIFYGSWSNSKNKLELKTNPPSANLALPKLVKHTISKIKLDFQLK